MMVGIYDLDVSMTLDDLAWHFGNHSDERFLQETVASPIEPEANDAAALFLCGVGYFVALFA
ncbi:MAG TPA: hypothetical protein VMU26_12750 [Candidatus Polarisedimenticolia bacterium]|nr:hypothetical protein [Candidatus Polarisedimenticolia bacterium]